MARVKYYDPKTGAWKYADKNFSASSASGGNVDPTVYGLPVLYLTGDTTGMSKEDAVTLGYAYGERSGSCTLKWQGSSSLEYPKKNYTIKFDNAFEAAEGWGEQKKYCLKANFIDHSHARNIVSAKLWGEIVKSRAYTSGAGNLFDFTRVTGTPSTWEGETTFDENGVLTPGSSVSQSGYNPFNGIVFPAGTYTVRFDAMCTDLSKGKQVWFGFISTDKLDEPLTQKQVDVGYFASESNTWGSVEETFDVPQNVVFFLQPSYEPSYFRFRNIQILNADGGAGTPDPMQLLDLINGGAIDGFPVCVYINGQYTGLYTFNIPKDGWMMDMGSGEQEAILCADYSEACYFRGLATLDGDFELEYVSDEDNAEWVTASVNRLISAVMNSDGTDLDTTIAQYLDWQSAVDYLIFKSVLNGIDMGGKNYLLSTYDGVKWFFGAYDLDSTYGLWWNGQYYLKAQHGAPLMMDTRVDDLILTHKKDALKARYAELRSSVLSDDNVATMFRNFIGGIPSPVFIEDVRKWPTIPNSATSNAEQIIDYYVRRAKWVDEYMDSL